MEKVYINYCKDYEETNLKRALEECIIKPGLLDFVTEGSVVGIKANLVSALSPDRAATTNPKLLKVLCDELVKRGASVIIGDSPGGTFNESNLRRIYKETKMVDLVNDKVSLNHNFAQSIRRINGIVVKDLDVCDWLFSCDYIINVCKLKSHGMMGLSAATKNLFGTVPGLLKPEYHYRYPNHQDFAKMIIDINEYYKCSLHIIDGIVAMEGNGPTQGKPTNCNVLMASKNSYCLDLLACKIIGLDPLNVPIIKEAIDLGLCPTEINKLDIQGEYKSLIRTDFENILPGKNMEFTSKIKGPFKNVIGKLLKNILQVKPKPVKKECIGCRKCESICPVGAIKMKKSKPIINRKLCIKCFCCQEFCPVGAMKANKNLIMKVLTKSKDK